MWMDYKKNQYKKLNSSSIPSKANNNWYNESDIFNKLNMNSNSQLFASSSINISKLLQSFDNNTKEIEIEEDVPDNNEFSFINNNKNTRKLVKVFSKSKSTQKLISSSSAISKREIKYMKLRDEDATIENENKINRSNDECTFTPNIRHKIKRLRVRSAQRFYQDQQGLELKKVLKLYRLEKEIFKQNDGKQKLELSKNTEELALKRNLNEINIYKRLYKK